MRISQRYIKSMSDVGLVFDKDINSKQHCMGHVDSDYVRDLDKCRSTIGYVFTLSQTPMS